MDRFALSERLKNSPPIDRIPFMQNICRNRIVLDLGCIRHNAEFAIKDPDWLHGKIKAVAKKVIGVDYLAAEVEKLKDHGYNIIYGDVTKPLDIQENFDIIIAGDLIEHLSNFEGFFDNCTRLLKTDGNLLLTTPNPFYADEFYYTAIKKNFLINPEHTCWIDPQSLSQLSARFGYEISDAYYIKNSWKLKALVCESRNNQYDILNGKWEQTSKKSRLKRRAIGVLFNMFYKPHKVLSGANTRLVKYSDYLTVLKRSKV